MNERPVIRHRRLRTHPWIRELVQEARLDVSDLILPLFVQEGKESTPIPSLPGVSRLSIDALIATAKHARDSGIPAIALFPVTSKEKKSADGKEALNPKNLVCRAIAEVKCMVPEIGIIADVALDPYTTHGHDGVLDKDGNVANDATVDILTEQATVLARVGADIVAPSDMMDGRVRAIRHALDAKNFFNTAILAYSAKYASALYGPFREAVGSSPSPAGGGPGWGPACANESAASKDAPLPTSPLRVEGYLDKRSYQMNPANADEAMREIEQDIEEGADMVMVKPGLPYMDIIYRASHEFHVPVFAYQVSGEYAMIMSSPNAKEVMLESLLALKRAGARAIFNYSALEVAEWL